MNGASLLQNVVAGSGALRRLRVLGADHVPGRAGVGLCALVWWDERGTAFDDQAVVVAANPASLIILSGAVGEPVAHDELPVDVAELVAELLVVAALRGLVLERGDDSGHVGRPRGGREDDEKKQGK